MYGATLLLPVGAGKTELDLTEESPVKLERSQVQDEMVALFGSERQKRAFAAYKRNKVGSEELDSALASAVSVITTSQEVTGGEGKRETVTGGMLVLDMMWEIVYH